MLRNMSLLALVLAGCQSDLGTVTEQEGRLQSEPVTDLGAVAVGTVTELTVRVTAARAKVQVYDASALNVDGTYFEVIGDDLATTLERDAYVDLTIRYSPQDEGYHRAIVSVTSDAKTASGQAFQFEVRGRASVPSTSVWPLSLDCGVVALGESETLPLNVANESPLPLILSGASFSDRQQFSISDTLPLEVANQQVQALNVMCSPLTSEAATTTLRLSVGDVQLPTVTVRMNDCRNGDPSAYNLDGDAQTTCGGDCNDDDPSIFAGATEVEDGKDQDCDSLIDEGTPGFDDDLDGYCDSDVACIKPGVLPGDCNDGDDGVSPGTEESLGNGIDDDCDGTVDAGTVDGDGDGYSTDGGDCDDANGARYPGNPEQPDGVDNDCDGTADEGTSMYDDDGDGFCDDPVSCTDGTGPGDCNDDPRQDGDETYPGAPEIPDWRDNDCDRDVDEGTERADDDGDGYTEQGGDCDDTTSTISPAVLELAGNGIDDDCDPATPSAPSIP